MPPRWKLRICQAFHGDSSSKNMGLHHQKYGLSDLAWVDLIKNLDSIQKCGVRRNVPSPRGYAPYMEISENGIGPRWRISYFAAVPKNIYVFDHIVPVMLQISKNNRPNPCLRRFNWIYQISLTTKMKEFEQKRGCISPTHLPDWTKVDWTSGQQEVDFGWFRIRKMRACHCHAKTQCTDDEQQWGYLLWLQ